MPKKLPSVFEKLVSLQINHGTDDITKAYQKISKEIDLNEFFEYTDDIRNQKGFSGVFRFVMNVMVSAQSDFIPFVTALGPDVTKVENSEEDNKADKLQENNDIQYNYSDFVSDFVSEKNDGIDIARLSFATSFNNENKLCIINTRRVGNVRPGEFWFMPSDSDIKGEDLETFIKERGGEKSFAEIVSRTYLSKGVKILYYTLINLDSSYDESGRLTRIMIASSNEGEATFFLQMNLDKLREIASFIRTRFVNDLLQKNRFESIKSAVSAIMSRNMSHNLGSHYMYYTKAYLEKKAIEEGSVAPDIRGAAKVLGYVQARMDYLATVISNDKYPYGPVNFKSQIYDELTVDDFSHRHFPDECNKRTTNFLLTNLILSENYSRPNVRDDVSVPDNKNKLFLYVKYSDDGKSYLTFTGSWYSSSIDWVRKAIKSGNCIPTKKSEQTVKNILSSLVIALPGGPMSSHAFFNVIENFIRNSAKYLRKDISKDAGLVCTIAIRPNEEDHSCVDFIIYDNKKNANKIVVGKDGKEVLNSTCLYTQILEKIGNIEIVDKENKISKENKGFKEMLFSSIWMRAYKYGSKTYADVISEINNENDAEKKLKLIEKYGFSMVRVVDNPKSGIKIYDRYVDYRKRSSLGIVITLPVFSHCQNLELKRSEAELISDMLNVKADIVEIDKRNLPLSYKNVFTRVIDVRESMNLTTLEKYKKILQERFPRIDTYSLCFMDEDGIYKEKSYDKVKKRFKIYFQRHMNTQRSSRDFGKYAYADSISGGDFTVTLLDLYKNGLTKDGAYIDEESEILALKIKESALTRVTIIDERLFKSTTASEYPWMSLKNIRVLNYEEIDNDDSRSDYDVFSITKIFSGSTFRRDPVFSPNETHFLSIHLGLIEKILKNSVYVNSEINKRHEITNKPKDLLSEARVVEFIKMIKESFGNNHGELYVAIHSGRGNYSPELEGPLKNYPFISLSALESAFNNSKYQLCQLLYNTVYIGKGRANNTL